MCDRQCWEDGFQSTTVMLEDRQRRAVNGSQWKRFVAAKRSGGKLAAGHGAMGFEHKVMDIYAGKKICAMNLLKEAVVALKMRTSKTEVTNIMTTPTRRKLSVEKRSDNNLECTSRSRPLPNTTPFLPPLYLWSSQPLPPSNKGG